MVLKSLITCTVAPGKCKRSLQKKKKGVGSLYFQDSYFVGFFNIIFYLPLFIIKLKNMRKKSEYMNYLEL